MMKDLSIQIGDLKIKNKVFLAPLAGITDMSFRILCKEMGAGLVYSEMISAKGLHYNKNSGLKLFKHSPIEMPYGVQIFGSEADYMAKAAMTFEELGAALIDINMGCPTPKIVKSKSGSHLMTDPKLAREIIYSVSNALKIPVTVKIRRGFKVGDESAVNIAKIAQEAGAKAVTVHGRYASQMYAGTSDWDIIKKVKEAISIPVIGNGDILSPQDAERILKETNCDGIMIGRGALGRPWIFKEIISYLESGKIEDMVSKEEVYATIKRHLDMAIDDKGSKIALREMRKHIAWYIKGYANSAQLRDKVFKTYSYHDLILLLDDFFH